MLAEQRVCDSLWFIAVTRRRQHGCECVVGVLRRQIWVCKQAQEIEVFTAIVREAQSLHASDVVVAPERNPEAGHRVEKSTGHFKDMMHKVASGLRNVPEVRGKLISSTLLLEAVSESLVPRSTRTFAHQKLLWIILLIILSTKSPL